MPGVRRFKRASLWSTVRRGGSIAAGARGFLACAITLIGCGVLAASAATGAGGSSSSPSAFRNVPDGDWTRFDYDAARSGVGPTATGITGRRLRLLRIRRMTINGTVDSSPIALHAVRAGGHVRDIVVMTTTYGRTLALDPGTGAMVWEFTPADIGAYSGSAQVDTMSPVADPNRRYVYASSPDGVIHKLSVANGGEVRKGHWPARVTFDPTKEKMDSALNLSRAGLLVTTGGYTGDAPTYEGHLVVISLGSGRILHVFNTLCSDRHFLIDPPTSCPAGNGSTGGSAIWARAGAVVEPGRGRILIATGNGPFNGATNWSDSVLELNPDASRLLHSWTPSNQAQLAASDTDIGSSAPALLPPIHGVRLVVQGAKDGLLHVLNLARLNGTPGGAGPRLGGQVQNISAPGGGEVLTAPAVWTDRGRAYVFVANDSGTTAYVVAGSRPRLHVAWQNSNPGTSPVLADGLLYIFDHRDGVLKVYGPATGRTFATLPAAGGHWNSPIVLGGRVILPVGDYHNHATTGVVLIYHLPGR